MSKLKTIKTFTCRVCGRDIQGGEAYEWVKHKGATYYVHTDCLKKKEGEAKR